MAMHVMPIGDDGDEAAKAGCTITRLAVAFEAGRDGFANGIVERMNRALAGSLNFPKWWSQDSEFELVLTVHDLDLVFTVVDRTGTHYSFSERSSGFTYCGRRQFQDTRRAQSYGRHSPGFQRFFHVYYDVAGVQINHVDSEAHAKGVNAAAGRNPKTFASGEFAGSGTHQAAQAAPMCASFDQLGGQICVPSDIVGISLS